MRRLTLALAVAVTLVISLSTTVASAAVPSSTTPIGPECDPSIVTAVLVATTGRVVPDQVIQHLEIRGELQFCTVTAPSRS